MAATGSLLRFALFGLARLLVALLLIVVLGLAVRPPSLLAAACLVAIRRGGAGRRVSAVGFGPHDDLRTLAELVGAVDHDAIAGLKARKYLDPIAVGDAELDRAYRHRAVFPQQIDEGAGHAALDARGRHRHHVLV